jgi:thiol-disulfide isomerase/thioredoxin
MGKTIFKRRNFIFFGLGIAGGGALTALFRYASSPMTSILTSANASSTDKNMLPEFQGISQWLNSEPLTTKSLKGSVVLVQIWTFGCINCQRTLPYITKWHQQYAAQGLKVIGVHTPEFAHERDINNIKSAMQQHQITYPVAVDNEFKTWNAYQNQYWPHLFLADRQGILRYDHIGEGAYDQTEKMIQQFLG